MLREQVGYLMRQELAIQTPGCPLKVILCKTITLKGGLFAWVKIMGLSPPLLVQPVLIGLT